MKKIYVAGSMSGQEIDFLRNVRKGIRASVELLLDGYAPFSPFIDFQFFLALRGKEEITVQQIKTYSLAWLEVSDAVLVLPDWEGSLGTQKEIQHAAHLGIPVFYDIKSLKEYFNK